MDNAGVRAAFVAAGLSRLLKVKVKLDTSSVIQ
jgi:hypothetical protein